MPGKAGLTPEKAKLILLFVYFRVCILEIRGIELGQGEE
jgi:hypothetical protein